MALRDEILNAVAKKGRNPIVGDAHTKMANYVSWYRGSVKGFHNYNIQVMSGNKPIQKSAERLTLQMAKKACEDWATLLFNEEVAITLKDETKNDTLWEVLEFNNFIEEMSVFIEKVFAVGTGIAIEYRHNDHVYIDFITGDSVVITDYRNHKVNGLVSVNTFRRGESFVTQLSYHDYDYINNIYKVEHEVYVSDKEDKLGTLRNLTEVFGDDAPIEVFEVETDAPMFQVFRPNIVNNHDMNSPYGISIFANGISVLQGIDKTYDSFINEYLAARHRVLLNSNMLGMNEKVNSETNTIEPIVTFDAQQMEFQAVPMGQEEDMKIYNADIREAQHTAGLNRLLQTYGFLCGLGTDYYAFDARGVYQNEKAVVSENSDLWASKKKHEILLTSMIRGMVKAIMKLKDVDIENDDIEIKTADSIFIDDEAKYQKDIDLLERGLLPEYKFLMKWYGLTETEAKEQIAEAQTPDIADKLEDNPLPLPNEGETEEEFIARFMSNEMVMEEYPNEEERREVAAKQWQSSET